MPDLLDNIFVQFIIGGSILAGGAYVANNFNAFFAALIGSFPLELIMLFLINKSKTRREYAKSLAYINLSLVIAGTLYYFLEPTDILSKNFEIIATIIVWGLISLFFYSLK